VRSEGVFMVSPFEVVELDRDCAPLSLAVFVLHVKFCEVACPCRYGYWGLRLVGINN
jgi:hypothetical protein